MLTHKESVIKKMQELNLPDYIIEEYESCEMLPYKKETIKIVTKLFGQDVPQTYDELGYTEEVSLAIINLYDYIQKSKASRFSS